MDRLDDKAMATNQALETLCFFCSCAPVATGITQIHFEMGGGITNRSHGLTSLYVHRDSLVAIVPGGRRERAVVGRSAILIRPNYGKWNHIYG